MRLHSLTFDELKAAGVNAHLAQAIVNPNIIDPCLDIFIQDINWEYYISDDVESVVPLWSSNEDTYCRWRRNGETEYVLLFHDDPKFAILARTEQGLLAELYRQYWEFQDSGDDDVNDKKCRVFADAIGFEHREEADTLLLDDYDTFKKWQRKL